MRDISKFAIGLPILAVYFLFGCSRPSETEANSDADSVLYIPRNDLGKTNELKTATGKLWIVHQTPMMDTSVVNVQVDAIGFSDDTLSFDFGQLDPVAGLQTEDLDGDGFQELYVITQSLGTEAFGTLYGVYAMNDDSLSLIAYEGATPYLMKEGEAYFGYRGHDSFRFEKGTLTNTIPVYRPEDGDDSPSGGTRTITYELLKGKVSIQLRPKRNK